ncbi:hypothetical protein [Clostridium sp. JN-1]|uniref:hypothetical protein n=1 Tax=Clostridium sp. JN-1 TaxID=2483110 RepID=UPI000F0B50BB|nr:hypothetical protein [Clostridium sp. JN-1]
MKSLVKILTSLLFLIAIILIPVLNSEKNDIGTEKISAPDLGKVTVLDNKDENYDLYKIENDKLNSVGTMTGLKELVYNTESSIYAYSMEISKGNNLVHNFVQIMSKDKFKKLDDFYCASDLKLSPSGHRIAFRTFKDDSNQSAEGMRIYDIEQNKYVNLNSKVLVSGNLYEWLDDDHIVYYGTKEGIKDSSKIYIYNLKDKKESAYFDKIDGYYIYFKLIDNNLFIFSRQTNGDNLYYYNFSNNTVKNIKSNVTSIYDSKFSEKNQELYFLGTEDNKYVNLYKFSPVSLNIDKITYDFPKSVNPASGIAEDNDGNIFFCGSNLEDQKNDKQDIFVYLKDKNCINLISDDKSTYKLYNDEYN